MREPGVSDRIDLTDEEWRDLGEVSLMVAAQQLAHDHRSNPSATFAEADAFDFSDISLGGLSREEIAEILIDAALDSRDDAEFAAEFYDPNQLRDDRGRWATGGGGGTGLPHAERQAQRESAKETVRSFMAGKGSPSLQEASGLAQALSTLTVAQIHEVKREHGLKASAPDKAGLVAKLAERFRAARESKPAEKKPSEKKPAESNASDLRREEELKRTHELARFGGGRSWDQAKRDWLAAGGTEADFLDTMERLYGHWASSLGRREAVKSAIGDTYSQYNGTHQLLQDIASKHDTLAGALAEAERQGLIDTRQRSSQTDVSPLQRDRQGEWVRRVLEQAYGEKEADH